METKQVRRYGNPSFPTRQIIDAHPELLKLVPKRWQGNPVIIAALTGLCILMAGCKQNSTQSPPSRVAPIFVHGNGRGSFGCQAVNPPVLLSENEAQQVVRDEFKRAGLKMDLKTKPSLTVHGPATTTLPNRNIGSQRLSIQLDGKERKHNIAFEYVSGSDFDKWERVLVWDSLFRTTACRRDILGAAKTLRSGLAKKQPPGTYAVFYDPCVGRADVEKKYGIKLDYDSEESWKTIKIVIDSKAETLSKEQLREQVKDFIRWLKAQGVI